MNLSIHHMSIDPRESKTIIYKMEGLKPTKNIIIVVGLVGKFSVNMKVKSFCRENNDQIHWILRRLETGEHLVEGHLDIGERPVRKSVLFARMWPQTSL